MFIPKADGTQRPLGVPTVLDRMIQQAMAQVPGTALRGRGFSPSWFVPEGPHASCCEGSHVRPAGWRCRLACPSQVGTLLFGSALHGSRVFRFRCLYGPSPVPGSRLITMASADFPTLQNAGISPGKDALLPDTTALFTSTTEPVDFAVLCQLAPPRRPSIVFLFIGPSLSSSLPPPGRLPSRSWLQRVI